MLYLVVSDERGYRHSRVSEIVASMGASEVITLDDTLLDIAGLEQYLYPSLFSPAAPVVHLRFMLDGVSPDAALAKKLAASPTLFLFEELLVPAPMVTVLKKYGAIVHAGEKQRAVAKKADIFAATAVLTAPNKKDRWLAYQSALDEHAVEAILGILYWKVRDLMIKGRDAAKWRALYTRLLTAHADAWQSGMPLAAAIEKVILTA